MGKYAKSIALGAVVALLGIIALARWRFAFMLVLKGTVPVLLVFAGVIAIIAGLSELKEEAALKNKEVK